MELEAFRFDVAAGSAGRAGLERGLIREAGVRAVKRVPHNGVPDGGHVHADLMCAAGFDADANEREFAVAGLDALDDFVVRDRGAGALRGAGGHARAPDGVATQGRRDGALVSLNGTVHQRDVGFADLARRE